MKKKLHVMITVPLKAPEIEKIAAVSPDLKVSYATDEVRAELRKNPPAGIYVPKDFTEGSMNPEEASRALDRMLADTEVIFAFRLPQNVVARAPGLKWVQAFGAGTDQLGNTGMVEAGVKITNASGVNTAAVAEFVLCQMLMTVKNSPRFLASAGAHRWEPYEVSVLKGKTAGIIGVGHIGGEVARLARSFGMKTLGVRRSAKRIEENAGGVDILFPQSKLLDMLPACDFVVLAVPLSEETRGIIGEKELKAMKPTAHIVNIARGPVIRQDLLIRALKEGWIAGAALDVFDPEPLPADNELWSLKNVMISPHLAGRWDGHTASVTDFFCENLRRYMAGEEMLNLVPGKTGYSGRG